MTDKHDDTKQGETPQADTGANAGDDPQEEPVPITEDGIPLIVNGVELNEIQIAALREARERRAAIDAKADVPREIDGPDRAEATRYGDWEKAGRAIDFS